MKQTNGKFNQIPYEQLTDTPSRLFRKITDQELKINVSSWKTYLDDYIRKLHPDRLDDMETVKRERSTTIGNVNDTLWQRPTLTFKKLLTGLCILKAKRVKVSLEVEFKSGKIVNVSEEFITVDNMGKSKVIETIPIENSLSEEELLARRQKEIDEIDAQILKLNVEKARKLANMQSTVKGE